MVPTKDLKQSSLEGRFILVDGFGAYSPIALGPRALEVVSRQLVVSPTGGTQSSSIQREGEQKLTLGWGPSNPLWVMFPVNRGTSTRLHFLVVPPPPSSATT